MANLNDYKLLSRICQRHFEMASKIVPQLGTVKGLSEKQIERYGFYYLVLQHFTGVADYSVLTELITDQEFNSAFFSDKVSDEGVDAVYIDEEDHNVYIFNH